MLHVTARLREPYLVLYQEHRFNVTILILAFPVTEALDHGKHTVFINVVTAVLGAMFFIAAIIVVMIFKKLKREKIKKQLAIETARAVIVTHWTKKVVVEKPQMNGTTNTTEEGLVSLTRESEREIALLLFF